MMSLTKRLIFISLVSNSSAGPIDWKEGDDSMSLLQIRADLKRSGVDQTSPGCLNAKQWYDLHATSFIAKQTQAHMASQGNQDRVLHSLFGPNHLGVTNKFYVEFGFNQDSYDEVGSGPNTERLYKKAGWSGLEMDGSHENVTMNLRKEFITRDNVASLFTKYEVPKEPDYVSVDIDSCDLWVFLGIVESEFRPRVFTVEYNAYWPLEKSVTNVCKRADGKLYRWHGDNMHGASLAALNKAANDNGYTIVYVTKVLDAFMVRKDLICPGTELPIETFRDLTGLKKEVHKTEASPEELAMWMQDY
jgi:hypothetical protein